MLEILSPAGSGEGVIAAVQNGADAVYLGFGNYNARRNAKNFNEEDFKRAVEYCRIRGVKVYVTINTLLTDRELPSAVEQARIASRCGADALIVQDLGMIRAIRQALPDMPIHGSTQMSVHNLEGVKMAAAMGITRVVLARELSRDEIEYICRRSPIEIEVFVHGALCMCYSGQCYMSAVIGRRSGNRGLCAQPCRQKYSTGAHGSEYPLSLKDNCLIKYVEDLERIGVSCIKIEGRMRRPEYAAIVTGIYSRAIKDKAMPREEDFRALRTAFSRQGFTDGYYRDLKGPDMFGIRTEEDKGEQVIFATAKKNYLNGEYQRVPVNFMGLVKSGETAKLIAVDDRGNTATAEGLVPETAFHKELTPAAFQTQLHKTGGTPFVCAGVKSKIEPGLSLAMASVNEMRRTVLTDLMKQRREFVPGREQDITFDAPVPNKTDAPVFTISVLKVSQLSREMAELKPRVVYVPAEEFETGYKQLKPFLDDAEISVCVVLPRVIHDNEVEKCTKYLEIAKEMGVTEALVGNIGHIPYAMSLGFKVRGDFGLNVYNSQTLGVFNELGLLSATLSFEMRLEQIRDISKTMDTEIFAYGRLPLMVTENCMIRNARGVCNCDSFTGITDKMGATFPVVREFGCRNVVLNSQKLFMADKMRDIDRVGVWAARLSFTTENSRECLEILKSYMGLAEASPGGVTRGLYYRGVE